jgi:hypothetical protein
MNSRIRTLSVREQAAWMRSYYPTFSCAATSRTLCSAGCLQPTSASRKYDVIVLYEAGLRPAAYVKHLRIREGETQIPHTYAPDRPCLFYPAAREWRPDMRIATTVIPWLSLWLFYYEVWLATGEWEGGGVAHGPILDKCDVSDS